MVSFTDDRYSRHHLIPGFSQELVLSLRIAVIGAGAIGNEVIKNLLLMGVGKIDVFDFDIAERSNLTRSVFLRESDIGLNKAHALIARAKELNPGTKMRAFAGPIDRTLSLTQFAQYDMVVAAVDNIEARLRINDMALLTGCAWVNVAIDSRSVVVELFPQSASITSVRSAACYACNLPDSTFERIAQRYSCGGLQRTAYLTRTVPTTAVTASTAAALCCSEVLRYLHSTKPSKANAVLFSEYKSDVAQRIFFDTVAPCISRTFLARAPSERGCPGCGLHQAMNLVDGSSMVSKQLLTYIDAHLQNSPLLGVRFSDALIVDCHCTQCGASAKTSEALQKLLGLRAKDCTDAIVRCPHCMADTVSIDVRETLNLKEFALHFQDALPDCAWLLQGDDCIDLLPTND
jgi:molybdopterin-synthase adenylyltransferase